MLLTICGAAILFAWQGTEHSTPTVNRPIEKPVNGYVKSSSCRSCHPQHHASWHASYHRTMTQLATPQTVLAPFDDVSLILDGEVFLLSREGDQFYVSMEHPLWSQTHLKASSKSATRSRKRVRWPIVMVTGSHHNQTFWYAASDDPESQSKATAEQFIASEPADSSDVTVVRRKDRTVGRLPFLYLIEQGRWIPERTGFIKPPEKVLPRHTEVGPWNLVCLNCHTTDPRSRPYRDLLGPPIGTDAQVAQFKQSTRPVQGFDTLVAEFGISCEACHGPGEQHVAVNQNPVRRYGLHLSATADTTIVNPARLNHKAASQICGRCHSISCSLTVDAETEHQLRGESFRPGQDLTRKRYVIHAGAAPDPVLSIVLAEDPHFIKDRFWSDGMVRVIGREYNALEKNPCFQRGELSCLSCHKMHHQASSSDGRSSRQWANDQLKAEALGNSACTQCHAHSKLADPQSLTEHTHHAADSSGSSCYNCHMPHTNFGLQRAMRSHQIDSPSVRNAITARPNACNQCHLDQTLAWTADRLEDWYGLERPTLSADQRTIAASILWALQGDAGQRALMAWNFQWLEARAISGGDWPVPVLARLLNDDYDHVRLIAEQALQKFPGQADFASRHGYEFRDAAPLRGEAVGKLLRSWQTRSRRPQPALLIGPTGQSDQPAVQRLWDSRDRQRVRLAN